ncbi:hypothetical protein Scep_006629 [Stephania cephalantha]|uniref:Uncharacterized protein n=1 Tax=Stephania cephalantha TaxID=152367 RepID=A0AAP0KAV2_9MAGN
MSSPSCHNSQMWASDTATSSLPPFQMKLPFESPTPFDRYTLRALQWSESSIEQRL